MNKLFKKALSILVQMDKKGQTASTFLQKAITILIAVAIIPAIVAGVNSVVPNLTGGALIMIGLVTLIFVAAILMFIMKGIGK